MTEVLKCPECGETKSGRTWLNDGVVRCWECNKLSKYEDWYK